MNSMLTAVPKRWSSWDFTVTAGSEPVAQIETSWWGEKGLLTVGGMDYRVYREGTMSRGDFIIESAGSVVARAEKPSAFRRTVEIRHGSEHYTLRAKNLGRTFLVFDGNREIGSLTPQGFFTRRVAVDLPDGVPLPVRMFILWLAVILWRRDAAAAA